MVMSNHSYIDHTKNATAYVGPDAVNLARARMLASSITLYLKTGLVPTRGVGMKQMLLLASVYSGKTYKRSRADLEQAASDVRKWADTMAAAIPTTVNGKEV